MDDEDLNDTIPLVDVPDAGVPENILADPLKEMDEVATNQVLLEKYLWY